MAERKPNNFVFHQLGKKIPEHMKPPAAGLVDFAEVGRRARIHELRIGVEMSFRKGTPFDLEPAERIAVAKAARKLAMLDMAEGKE